jgi:imidazolonepropionase-like amidohydrolase
MILSMLAGIALLGAAGEGAVYIRAGNVFDGERFVGSRVIVVDSGRIAAVEESCFMTPAGAEVIEATDATVMPGFIDGHCHFMETPKPYADNFERYGRGRLEAEAMSSFAGSRRHLLLNGITTIADMGGSLAAYRGLRAALNKGTIIGPDLYFSGPQITAPGGHPAGTTYLGNHDLIDLATFQTDDTAAVRRKVAALAKNGVDFIAVVYDDGAWVDLGHDALAKAGTVPGREGTAAIRYSPRFRRLKLDVAKAAIDEAHRQGLKAFADIGTMRAVRDIEFHTEVNGFEIRTATPSGRLVHQMIPFLVDACGEELSPAICTDFPESGEEHCGDGIFVEMKALEETGASRPAVLRATTSGPAVMSGKFGSVGRVAAGYRANLVFMRGSVDTGLLSADRIERVMLHGRTVVQDGRVCADCEKGFRENSLSYLGYPYWDPLLSWMAGGTVTDYDFLRTGITAEADLMYSIRNMWFANAVFDLPSPIPRTALRAGMHFDNQNRLFYGLGNDTHLADTTEYSNLIFREWASGRTTIYGPWKALSYVVFDQTMMSGYPRNDTGATKARNDTKLIGADGRRNVTSSRAGRTLPDSLDGNSGGNEIALSLTFVHDTRDHQANPWYGHYVGLGIQVAPAVLPRGHSFEKVVLDARGYVSPAHRHILAGRLLCQQAFGDVPFYYLPEFGGDTLGRGYMPFRFRDRVSVIGQLEYRFPIWSFLSGAVFAEAGQFQPAVDKLRLGGFHPSIGFGPRFNFGSNESSIVGIDVGFTPEGWNLVLHNGQVF